MISPPIGPANEEREPGLDFGRCLEIYVVCTVIRCPRQRLRLPQPRGERNRNDDEIAPRRRLS